MVVGDVVWSGGMTILGVDYALRMKLYHLNFQMVFWLFWYIMKSYHPIFGMVSKIIWY